MKIQTIALSIVALSLVACGRAEDDSTPSSEAAAVSAALAGATSVDLEERTITYKCGSRSWAIMLDGSFERLEKVKDCKATVKVPAGKATPAVVNAAKSCWGWGTRDGLYWETFPEQDFSLSGGKLVGRETDWQKDFNTTFEPKGFFKMACSDAKWAIHGDAPLSKDSVQ
jgi:hypothetical protein